MFTDAQKYGALLNYHIRDRREQDVEFSIRKILTDNVWIPRSGKMMPAPLIEARIVKAFPALKGFIWRENMRKVHLTKEGHAAFAKLYANGGAKLIVKRHEVPMLDNDGSMVKAVEPAQLEMPAAKPGLGGPVLTELELGCELTALAFTTANTAAWLAMLDNAQTSKVSLAQLCSILGKAVARGAR